MSPGAKLVYAAVFASDYRRLVSMPPAEVIHDSRKWEDWETGMATSAAEVASGAARRFDEIEALMVEGFGEGSEVLADYREMRRK